MSFYPEAVQERLEAKHLEGGSREVPLAGLGGVFEHVGVDLGEGEDQPLQFNVQTGGRRDVRRVEVSQHDQEVVVHIVQERGWRIADFSAPGLTEERRASLAGHPGGGDGGDGVPPSPSTKPFTAVDEVQEGADRAAQAAEDEKSGLVALWQWSKVANITDPESVPEELWGIYSEEQNTDIEAAYAAGNSQAAVGVGIRTYEISFRGLAGGRQVDKGMRKRRMVRRRAVTVAQRDAVLSADAAQVTNENIDLEADCAICVTCFAETPSVPVVTLPGCGHRFHGACIQQIADEGGLCPFCRATVDWDAALSLPARIRTSM